MKRAHPGHHSLPVLGISESTRAPVVLVTTNLSGHLAQMPVSDRQLVLNAFLFPPVTEARHSSDDRGQSRYQRKDHILPGLHKD